MNISSIGTAVATHPGLATFGIASAALIGVSIGSHGGKLGGMQVDKLSYATGGVGALMGLFCGGKAGAVGWGMLGASLLTRGITATQS